MTWITFSINTTADLDRQHREDSGSMKPTPTPTPTPIAPAALVFGHYAETIKNAEGIDPFEEEEVSRDDDAAVQRMLKKFRKARTFTDDFLNEVWSDYLSSRGVLSKEEQHTKDGFGLQIARDTKAALSAHGLSDAARFGFCKRPRCTSGKIGRLLLRGFCPDCRGVSVKQTIAEGGSFNALVSGRADATVQGLQTTSLAVSVNRRKIHPATKELTTEERRTIVRNAREQHPGLSISGLAKKVNIPRKTVSDILKSQPIKTTIENTDEVQQFLIDRAERQERLTDDAKRYLESRSLKRPMVGAEKVEAENDGAKRPQYMFLEKPPAKGVETATSQNVIICPSCLRSVVPGYHYWATGACIAPLTVSNAVA